MLSSLGRELCEVECPICHKIHFVIFGAGEMIFCACGATIVIKIINLETREVAGNLYYPDRNFSKYVYERHQMDDARVDPNSFYPPPLIGG